MKLKEYISEEFAGMVKSRYGGSPYSIYKEPTYDEYMEMVKEHNYIEKERGGSFKRKELKNMTFRALLDLEHKTIYVFNSNLLHENAIEAIAEKLKTDNYVHLSGSYEDKKLNCGRVFTIKEVGKDYAWMSKFLTGFVVSKT